MQTAGRRTKAKDKEIQEAEAEQTSAAQNAIDERTFKKVWGTNTEHEDNTLHNEVVVFNKSNKIFNKTEHSSSSKSSEHI